MYHHLQIAGNTEERKKRTGQLIRAKEITLGGNKNLRIYGLLGCASGKRLKTATRVFFKDEAEAIAMGYRPCGHCMRNKYKIWKSIIGRASC